MRDLVELVWLIPALPLLGFLLLVPFGRKLGNPGAGYVATLMVAGSFGATVLVFLGLTMLINGALANGILQSVVPDELRGRVMATYVFVYVGFTPIGSFIAGAMARFVGVQWAIFVGGVVMLAYSMWAFWKYPEIRAV